MAGEYEHKELSYLSVSHYKLDRTMRTDSLHFKINAAILVASVVIAITFGAIFYSFEIRRRNAYVKNIHLLLNALFHQKNDDLANELFSGQKRALALSLRKILKVEGIVADSTHIPDGELFLSTDGGSITFFNNSLCKISGYTRDELLGMNNRQYTTPETSKKMFQAFNEMHHTGKSARIMEYEGVRKDGSKRILELSVSLMWDSAGQAIGFRGVSCDTTERRKTEQALRESERRLADATFVIDRENRVIAWNLDMDTLLMWPC